MSGQLEQVGVEVRIDGLKENTEDAKKLELVLRQTVKTLDDSAKALQTEIIALREAAEPNRELIRQKQILLNQTRLTSVETRANIADIRQQAQSYREASEATREHKSVLASVGGAVKTSFTETLKLIGVISTLVTGYELLRKVALVPEAGKVFEVIQAGAGRAKEFVAGVASKFSSFGASLKSGIAPAVGFAGGIAGATAAVGAFTVAVGAATLGLTVIIGAFTKLFTAIPDAINAGREFEAQMRSVSTAMDGTDKDVQKLSNRLLDLSTKLNAPAVELAAAQYEILSAGISDVNLAFEATEASAKLATAGLSTTAEAADLVTSAINAYGIGPKEAADILFKTIQDGKTTASGLSQSFGLVAGSAQSAGVSFKELNAATAALTLTGQTASTAQNNLRAAISNITQPSEEAKKVAKALGLEFNGAALQSKGLTGFLEDMKAKVGDNKSALGQLFGSVEAYNAIVKLTGVSQQEYNRILEDLNNANGAVDEGFAKQRDSVKALGNAINNELIKAGRAILSQLNPVLEKMIEYFTKSGSEGKKLIDALQDLFKETVRFSFALGKAVAGLVDFVGNLGGLINGVGLSTAATRVLAESLDLITTSASLGVRALGDLANAAMKLGKGDLRGVGDIANNVKAYTGAAIDAFVKRTVARFSDKGEEATTPGKIPPPLGNPDPNKSKEINVAKTGANSQSKRDNQAIENVTRSYDHQIEQLRQNTALAISQMGAFANQGDVLTKQFREQNDVLALLNSQLAALDKTTVKSADGQRALTEARNKAKDAIAKQKDELQKAANALKKYQSDIEFQNFKRDQGLEEQSAQQTLETNIKGAEEQIQRLEEDYSNRKLKIIDFYTEVETQIKEELRLEQEAYEKKIEFIDKEIAKRKELFNEKDDSAGILDLKAQKTIAYNEFLSKDGDFKNRLFVSSRNQTKDLTDNAKQFGEALENAITDALQDGFNGSKPLSIIKQFAKTLYSTLTGMLSKALAEKFVASPWMTGIKNSVGNLINATSGQAPIPGTQVKTTSGIGGFITSIFRGKSNATTATASSPAASTASAGGASILAAFAPIGIAAMSLQKAMAGGGSALSKYGRFIDPLGFRKLIGLGGKSQAEKQAERAAYQQNTLAPFLNKVVSGADSNDLNSLAAARLQAARGKPGRGSNGMALKRQAMEQIDEMIKAREKTIDEFIKTITRQNTELTDTIALADAEPIEKAAIQHKIELARIVNETQDLLAQYKDSEQAKTMILEQEALKRKQLLQSEQQDFKDKTQDLSELLKQRDDIANSNVFTRLTSAEQNKKDQISALDKTIAEAMLELKGMQNAGITADSHGSNQLLNGLAAITQTNNLQVIVNEANNPNAVREQITRALDAWTRKTLGANA